MRTMMEADGMIVGAYLAERRRALKHIVKQLRLETGYTQHALAELLGCARTRITDIEKLESLSEYSLAEMEVLAALCGKHPFDVLRTTGQNAIDLGRIVTTRQTSEALLGVVDCVLPQRIIKLSTNTEFFPASLLFSRSGAIIASIIDAPYAEDWEELYDEPYQYMVLCWDSRSGKIIGEICLPYIEHITLLDDDHLVLVTSRPTRPVEDARDYEGENTLLVWNVRRNTLEWKIPLLDRVGAIAASLNNTYLATFFPTTTTLQVWRTSDWAPVRAFELETLKGDLSSLGSLYREAHEVHELPRERKFGRWIMDYSAKRFDFLNDHVLVFGSGDRVIEFNLHGRDDPTLANIEHPILPWGPIAHHRDRHREIAVTAIDYHHQRRESQVTLWYLQPREQRYPPDTYVQRTKYFLGAVQQPTIIDETCILSMIIKEGRETRKN